jgi:Subtilase family
MASSWNTAVVAGIFPDPDHPVDPYLVWAQLSDFAGFELASGRPVPVLFALASQPGLATSEVESLVERCQRANPLNRVRPTQFGTANVGRDELPLLCEAVRSGLLARFQLGLPRGEREIPEPRPVPMSLIRGGPLTDRLQTIGVIDDGCCLAHEALRSGSQSRFVAVWDQDAHAPDDPIYWKKSTELPYGVDLRIGAVESLFARQPAIGEVAERACYEAIRRPEWGAETRRHGAGVLHVLAGAGERFIFVQLPGETVADSSGGSLGVYLIDGVRYIVRETEALARRERCENWTTTINVSLGSIAGPHDGTTITESALAEIATDDRIRIVLAAGNTSGKRVHGMRVVRRGAPGRYDVMVPPDNPRESFVELWLPEQRDDDSDVDPADFEIELVAPDGSTSPRIGIDQASRLAEDGLARAAVVFCRRVAQGRHGTMILVALRSTRVGGVPGIAHAPYGVWSINLHSAASKATAVHAWVERNDLIVGRRRPQQAFFVDDPEDRYVRDEFTLSSIANGANVTVVGGYRIADETVADYSARGPTLGAARNGPDMLGPSEESATLPGLPVPGFYSGWTSRMSGTSVAAPHVARWLVRGSPEAQRFEVKPVAQRGARRAPEPIPAVRP